MNQIEKEKNMIIMKIIDYYKKEDIPKEKRMKEEKKIKTIVFMKVNIWM